MNKTRRRKQRALAKRRKVYASYIETALLGELAKGPIRYDAEGRARIEAVIDPLIEVARRGYAIRPIQEGVSLFYEDKTGVKSIVVESLK